MLVVLTLRLNIRLNDINCCSATGNSTIATLPKDRLPVVGFQEVSELLSNLAASNRFERVHEVRQSQFGRHFNQQVNMVFCSQISLALPKNATLCFTQLCHHTFEPRLNLLCNDRVPVFCHEHYMNVDSSEAVPIRFKLHCQDGHYADTMALW